MPRYGMAGGWIRMIDDKKTFFLSLQWFPSASPRSENRSSVMPKWFSSAPDDELLPSGGAW